VKKLFRHLRLLPAVILLGTGLLVVKGVGLAREARAETAGSPDAAQAAPAPAADADPAADDSESVSAAEVDVLTSLSHRRSELDAREQQLTLRENMIAAAEARVDGKIAELKTLQSGIQTLLGQRDAEEEKQVAALVKTYSSMKPKDAARIFNTLDDPVLLAVAQEMKPDILGAIMAAMQPDQAQKLTVKLADRLKLPAETAKPEAQNSATMAAVAPTPAQAIGMPSAPDATSGSVTVPPASGAVTPPPQAAAPQKSTAPAKAGG
jgi:flagellar motility protein MotE (MotC chaperone)